MESLCYVYLGFNVESLEFGRPFSDRRQVMRMKNRRVENKTFSVGGTIYIKDAVAKAITFAKKENRPIRFTFHDVIVRVNPNSNPKGIVRNWWRAYKGYIPRDVGPKSPALTEKEMVSDARIEMENKNKYKRTKRLAEDWFS